MIKLGIAVTAELNISVVWMTEKIKREPGNRYRDNG